MIGWIAVLLSLYAAGMSTYVYLKARRAARDISAYVTSLIEESNSEERQRIADIEHERSEALTARLRGIMDELADRFPDRGTGPVDNDVVRKG